MLKVIFLILGFILCFVGGFMLCCMGVYVSDHIGTLRAIYVNDRFERMSIEFDSHESKDKLRTHKYALVNIERIYNEDLDEVTPDEQAL